MPSGAGNVVGMPPRRRTDPAVGETALTAWLSDPDAVDRPTLATAVRFTLEELGARAPGRSVEVRVPPFGAAQAIEGPRHTRGTPPNVVEAEPLAFVELCAGRLDWAGARGSGACVGFAVAVTRRAVEDQRSVLATAS